MCDACCGQRSRYNACRGGKEGIDRRSAHRRRNVRHDAGGRAAVAILVLLSGGLDDLGDALTRAGSGPSSAQALRRRRAPMVKACLIAGATLAVAAQIAWRLANPGLAHF